MSKLHFYLVFLIINLLHYKKKKYLATSGKNGVLKTSWAKSSMCRSSNRDAISI